MTPEPSDPAFLSDARDVLAEYGLVPLRAPSLVQDSVINENYRVETNSGPVFLKRHKSTRTLERLEREQAMLRWVGEAGVPVAVPKSTLGGETLVQLGGRYWSLYPWVDGRTHQRGSFGVREATKLGDTMGSLYRALARYPLDALPWNSELSWDTGQSISELTELAPVVERLGTPRERAWVEHQRRLLESGIARPCEEFVDLPRRASHGDFHERNVIFDAADELIAIVDWERACQEPPAFALLRAVSFMLLLDEEPLIAYLRAYRRHSRLAPETVGPCVEAWWQSSLHNTWALRDFFFAGNAATRQFFPEEERRSARYNDPAFRRWLAGMLVQFAS